MPELSQLKIYSYGKAAEDLAIGTDMLEVFCVEDHPNVTDEVTTNVTSFKGEGTSAEGAAYSAKVETSVTVKCKWLAISEPNRQTPPNVCRGERMVVYRFGNSSDYYWVTLDADLAYRKLETVVWAFSGTKDRNDSKAHEANTYFFEVSTHKGLVKLSTSKANGEPFRWEFLLDTKNGVFTIKDDADQAFKLDSDAKSFSYTNAVGSIFEIIEKAMRIEIPDSITQKTKQWVVEAQEGHMTFDQLLIEAETTHRGDFTLQGGLLAGPGGRAGGAAGSGMAQFSYPVTFRDHATFESNVTVNAVLTADKLVSKQAIDAPNV